MSCRTNVRSLTMMTSLDQIEFLGITFLLNSCPELEKLTIELGLAKKYLDYESPDNFNLEMFWTDHARAYNCMVYTLREVEIMGFKGSINEIRVITYFITIGRVLRKMTINILKDDDVNQDGSLGSNYRDMIETLVSLSASRDLEISIC
ncbi:F-box protein At3g62230-like [Lotus japonicus]|uniref:F-box protein At3g62230-like n=1 Tax=Lotus japonicus TaxID=34305 RepID=UPI0025876CB2|nr:F-box protein At3g62230-like [Lotus japonicus]